MTIPPRLMHQSPRQYDNLTVRPKPRPPADSWWLSQQTREEFRAQAKAQEPRLRGAAGKGREPQ